MLPPCYFYAVCFWTKWIWILHEIHISLQKTVRNFLKNEDTQSQMFTNINFRAMIAHDLVLRRQLK